MTTLLHRHPEQYFHESRFTRYIQYFRDVGPSYIDIDTKHIPHVPLQLCLAVPVEARLRLSKAAGRGVLRKHATPYLSGQDDP